MEDDYPQRKSIRLHNYDYSQNGVYFITICVDNRTEMLCQIVGDGVLDVPSAPNTLDVPSAINTLDVPRCVLSEYGSICEKNILAIGNNNSRLKIEKYVIMPNHIHMLVTVTNGYVLDRASTDGTSSGNKTNGTSRTPSPTNAVIPAFVSMFKRFVNKECGFNLFQRSYHDHIIRDDEDYRRKWNYIETNPINWQNDDYFIRR